MASAIENFKMEIERRLRVNEGLALAEEDTAKLIAQLEELDNIYKNELQKSRLILESSYKERKHFSGKWPIVYDNSRIENYPYFRGATDDLCNPYFPVSLIIAGIERGLIPVKSQPDRSSGGPNVRDRSHSPTEDAPRNIALTQLNVYPDYTGEPLPTWWPNEPPPYVPPDPLPPGYVPPVIEPDPVWDQALVAPQKLIDGLNIWKTDVSSIISDNYNNDAGVTLAYWNGLLTEINNCISMLTALLPRNFTRLDNPGSAYDPVTNRGGGCTPHIDRVDQALLKTSITTLKNYAVTGVQAFVTSRSAALLTIANTQEDIFYGIIKLRLHQVSGVFSKLTIAKTQKTDNSSIIKDNLDSIRSLNVLISQN